MLEFDRCVNELGFKGLKLVPTYQQYSPSDPRLDPMYEKCIELDIPCHIHMGWTPTIEALMKYQDPVLLDEVGVKFRDLKVIVAHLGYPWVDQAIALVAKHPNFYCEMAYWCGFGTEYLYQALFKLKAIGRVIYGSENFCTPFFPQMYEEVNEVAERMGVYGIFGRDGAVSGVRGSCRVGFRSSWKLSRWFVLRGLGSHSSAAPRLWAAGVSGRGGAMMGIRSDRGDEMVAGVLHL